MANARGKALVPTVLAAAGIVAGMFGPIVRAGIEVEGLGKASGAVTYRTLFETQGYVLMAICAAALVLAARGMGRWLWTCAAGVWITLLWPVIQSATTPADDSLGGQIKGIISDKVAEAAGKYGDVLFDVTNLSWGGFALLAGALIMIWAAIKGR